jgi:hypothetical protein
MRPTHAEIEVVEIAVVSPEQRVEVRRAPERAWGAYPTAPSSAQLSALAWDELDEAATHVLAFARSGVNIASARVTRYESHDTFPIFDRSARSQRDGGCRCRSLR